MEQDHSRLRELFVAACDLPEQKQIALLDDQCSDDPKMKEELLLLLCSDAKSSGIFSDEQTTNGIQFELDTVADAELPQKIGQYEITRVLGKGGMGVVYLAQQHNPRRDVAVKVIRSGMIGPELVKRFEVEAAVLGRLTHPGIARIYEAGLFVDNESGHERPFLAMEYIDGLPLRDFVKQKNPTKRKRLQLLVQICEAIHHAHRRGVIHRDLKPGNVLVKPDGQPSVLDFGVARATSLDSEEPALQTRVGQLIGTLPYMSPEQVSGKSKDVDTRSDVYSLGVMAYELLANELPYDLKNAGLLKAAKIIAQDDPTPLSSINREFRGDLNTVVLKSLEKEPDRRYQSAKSLGDDLQRYLGDQPVSARPATTLYQLKQFSKRNKALVTGFLVSIGLLVAGVIGTTIGMVNARNEAARKDAVNDFMRDILIAEDRASGNPNIKMVEVLRDAAASTPERFRDYPELEAEVSFLLGTAFKKLTMFRDATPLLRRAFEIHKSELGLSHASTRQTGAALASLMANRDAAATRDLANELLDNTPITELQSRDALVLRLAIGKALYRFNELDEAEKAYREVLAVASEGNQAIRTETGMRLAVVLNAKARRGMSEDSEKDTGEAIELMRGSLRNSSLAFGEGHIKTLQTKIISMCPQNTCSRLSNCKGSTAPPWI